MRVLIDSCLPVDLRHHLHGHDIETAAYRGWGSLENGELVGAAVEAGFEALITVDQGTAGGCWAVTEPGLSGRS